MTKAKKSYPFVTKAQIAASLSDYGVACAAMVILFERQTAYEQETSTTLNKNRRGFMSSHAVHGTRIAKALKAGEALSEEDVARVMAIAPRYTRQLADHLREVAVAEDPTLAEKASCFFSTTPPAAPVPANVPPPGSFAETARAMAEICPDFDWDSWKDEQKDALDF